MASPSACATASNCVSAQTKVGAGLPAANFIVAEGQRAGELDGVIGAQWMRSAERPSARQQRLIH